MWKHGLVGAVLVGSAWGQVTQRVSVGSAGAQGNGPSGATTISSDGRYVGFGSFATNLVSGDTNPSGDIFIRDRVSGTTERVSVGSGGIQSNGYSTGPPSLSADGRFVLFQSYASNLVPGDTNGFPDIFVRDRQNGTTERVNVSTSGVQANGDSFSSSTTMSSDGRFVVFGSLATTLVAGDTNAADDIFVRDRQLGVTERVSVGAGGVQGNGDSEEPSISANGQFVAFSSYATNLVAGDTNGFRDVFVYDRQTGMTERVSIDSSGAQANGVSLGPTVSSDGRYVAFASGASNLVPGDTNGVWDIFVHDRLTGTTERVSVDSAGVQGNRDSNDVPSVSSDGHFVAFNSEASNLVARDSNNMPDIFVHDRQSGITERVSIGVDGEQANSYSGTLTSISANGRYVAFSCNASDLVPGDSNGAYDVFVRDRFGGPTFTSLCDPGSSGVMACPCSNPPGGLDQGCDNSSATGGATLSAIGGTYISSDSLEFHVSGTTPSALSLLLEGTAAIPTGAVYGQGVRCVGGTLTRLGTKHARGGSMTIPDFEAGDPQVTAVSAAKGSPISAGDSRYYLVLYRDPVVLGGCPASSTFNCTQTGRIDWSP